MKVIILSTYPATTAPGQRFRYEQYLPYLESCGVKIRHSAFLSENTWNIYYKKGKTFQKTIGIMFGFIRRFYTIMTIHKYNHVYIYREAAPIGPPIFEWILAKVLRKKYIYDFDDAIWLPNYSESNARFQNLKAYWKVNYCMKWAHRVTAGNDYLANYARQFNDNVQVIPTTIDTLNLHNLTSNLSPEKIIIGWTGTHTTMHYLNEIVPVIEELEQQFSFEYRIISNEAPNFKLKSLKFVPWSKTTEIEDLAQITIGIMPLKEDQWSNGKCGFKALQYMSLGIPTIASPVGVNTQIIQHGENGIIANNEDEWKAALVSLLTNVLLREKIGKLGKQTIIERYSVLANKNKYLQLFQ